MRAVKNCLSEKQTDTNFYKILVMRKDILIINKIFSYNAIILDYL
jgi:hypothetical protein